MIGIFDIDISFFENNYYYVKSPIINTVIKHYIYNLFFKNYKTIDVNSYIRLVKLKQIL